MVLVSFFAIQNYNEQHTLANTSIVSEMTCMLQHPFTAVVAGFRARFSLCADSSRGEAAVFAAAEGGGRQLSAHSEKRA